MTDPFLTIANVRSIIYSYRFFSVPLVPVVLCPRRMFHVFAHDEIDAIENGADRCSPSTDTARSQPDYSCAHEEGSVYSYDARIAAVFWALGSARQVGGAVIG